MNKKRTIIALVLVVIVVLFLNLYTLPYYVSRPGMAEEIDTVIDVEDGYDAEGKLMLTTVWMGQANIISYLMTKFNKYYELYPLEDVRYEDETDEEYNVRQLYYMEDSQESALQVAFEKAGKEVHVDYKGIYVLSVLENAPATDILVPGDRITKIDNHAFHSSAEFTEYIQGKKAGDTISVTFTRNDETIEKNITIDEIEEIGKPGIGIGLVDDKEVKTDPSVEINTEKIGGPSAGLMFSLEIYNQLNEEDITKGYAIAGTGTISVDGVVGPIGGIEQKIVAADKAGAEIFFAPNENGAKTSNYQNAVKTAKDIGTDMIIVPVDTFDDAINYLNELEPKK
ncbi:PDZ domain-containing protein [Caldibacillus lycopersici]|uniref:endopeptidase La n=1 Tax=Perspicuibacillus lycopersici TaxID=1325689 RepID=A0AAE3IPU8_9BACI|nr:SepM family pheromone-processing serine protease [Perspicuibacillus lycopersici]MCU9612217.1 PDZ domain-containing protein [Perspicuibacillus lycopersici]